MIAAIIKGLVLGFFLAISVGPVIFAILKQSINNGHKAGYIFVAGISVSDITLVLICNFFTSLFASALNHRTFIAVAGSIFLVIMGIYTLFFKKVKTDEANNLLEKKFKTHQPFCLNILCVLLLFIRISINNILIYNLRGVPPTFEEIVRSMN